LAAPATSTPTITPEVAETAVPTADPGAGGAGGETVYVVQPGDTLFRIAARFNTTVGAMAQLNGIVNPSLIRVGQQLIVPGTGGPITSPQPTSPAQTGTPPRAAASYVVQPGDTVYRISLRFGVSMQALVEANGILNANLIYVGQTLLIP
jgi:LysM repeat protein